jgi:hypothetical protein
MKKMLLPASGFLILTTLLCVTLDAQPLKRIGGN